MKVLKEDADSKVRRLENDWLMGRSEARLERARQAQKMKADRAQLEKDQAAQREEMQRAAEQEKLELEAEYKKQ